MRSTAVDTGTAPRDRRRTFARIYRDHFAFVWSIVRHMGVHDAQHEDVLQEVWLRVYRRLHTLDPTASTKAWLCSIARHAVLHEHRSWYRRRRKLASLADQPAPDGDDLHGRHCAATTVARILDGMDADQRRVLVLAQVHGLSGPEIAEGLGIPLNTTYSRLRLARRHVHEVAANDDELARGEQPPRQAARSVWILLLPKLSTGAPIVASLGPWALLKLAVPATALAAAVVGAVAVVSHARASAPDVTPISRLAAATPQLQPHKDAGEPPPASQPAPANAAMTTASTHPVADATAVLPLPSGPAEVRPSVRSRGSEGVAGEPTAVVEPAPAPEREASEAQATTRLAEEARLMQQAQNALTAGDARGALTMLREHKDQFPAGQLADAREGLWVRALCKAGRGDEARARASKLAEQRPGSGVTDAVQDVCRQ